MRTVSRADPTAGLAQGAWISKIGLASLYALAALGLVARLRGREER